MTGKHLLCKRLDKMKITKCALNTYLAGSLIACSSLACAETLTVPGEFSANVALTTDYIFRGISQADEDPAIQGGMDYSLDTGQGFGIYIGFWGSNVEQGDANLELDIYGGLTGEIFGIGWDIGGIRFEYPDSDVLDYNEAYVGLSYTLPFTAFNPTLSAKVSYSPDFFAESGDALYSEGGLDLEFPYGIALGLHVGHQEIEDNDVFGTPDYTDWRIGLAKEVLGFTLDVSYFDTDLDEDECFDGTEFCDARAVFTISRSF